jgi:N-terminal acetyltransferase B complex non-catalytic subunit
VSLNPAVVKTQFTRHQAGWLSVFLKIYIKALSGASDLDLSVEDDKLLVGDRPRQSYNRGANIPLAERLAVPSTEELSEVYSLHW